VKAAPFELLRPRSAAEAVGLLGELGEEAKPLAGGQSLLPVMVMRLARPAHLIDLNSVADFTGAVPTPGGGYRLGPLVRHHDAERLAAEPGVGGYLGRVAPLVAHLPIRIRGTVAGSLAHADPASEWCTALLAAGASVTLRSEAGERTLEVNDFLQGSYTTAAEPEELLVEITIPAAAPGWGLGFDEISRRPGDFALAMAATAVCVRDGTVTAARVAVGSVSGGSMRCTGAEDALAGSPASADSWEQAGVVAADQVTVTDDIHTTAEHRRQLLRVTVRRALAEAARFAQEGG
jgi:aerobic carbon-monoxide dehydrogenase medium subunit